MNPNDPAKPVDPNAPVEGVVDDNPVAPPMGTPPAQEPVAPPVGVPPVESPAAMPDTSAPTGPAPMAEPEEEKPEGDMNQ